MIRIKSVNTKDILQSIILLIYLKPIFINEIPELSVLDNIFNIFQVLFIFILIFYILVNRIKLSKFILMYLIYQLSFLGQTIVYNGDLYAYISYMTQVIGVLLIINIIIEKGKFVSFSKLFYRILMVFAILNLISQVIYPLGWYANGRWFLGTGNNMLVYLLPYIVFSFISYTLNDKKNILIVYFAFIISIISVIIGDSSTSIITIFFMLFLFIILRLTRIKLSFKLLIILSLVFGVSIIFLNIQNYFSFIITNLFNKDITLSLRTLVWEKARLYISLRPIFGYGVEAASTTIVKTSAMHMHNIYLNNLYFGGVLSFIVFIFLLLITAIRIDKYKMHLIASIIIIGLGSFLIAMQTEVYIRNPIFYVLLMLSFHMSKIAPIKIKRPLRRTFSEVEYGNE